VKTLKDRILAKIVVTGKGCWEWTGARNWAGYGHAEYQGKTVSAHRLSYQAFIGPIPDGLCICHRCDNPSCVNPDHLWAGSFQSNSWDASVKGRLGKPRYSHRLLSDETVREVRLLHSQRKAGFRALSKQFGVSKSVIVGIVLNRTYHDPGYIPKRGPSPLATPRKPSLRDPGVQATRGISEVTT
jgi:hypothetical protein